MDYTLYKFDNNGVSISFYDEAPPPDGPQHGVILLIHGFPETSYEFRHVINLFLAARYRVIVPDYRGAGASSKPGGSYTKTVMADDMHDLLHYLGLEEVPVHIIGHDIGGMIAYNLVSRYWNHAASLIWGECPLPGTSVYDLAVKEKAVEHFHFFFHAVPDLPEALVTGKEDVYLNHFYNKLAHNASAFTQADVDHYVKMYSQPGALGRAFDVYRAFEKDAEENREWVAKDGKSKVRAMCLNGEHSWYAQHAREMMEEVQEEGTFVVGEVKGSGHWVAEENPEEFVRVVLDFIRQE